MKRGILCVVLLALLIGACGKQEEAEKDVLMGKLTMAEVYASSPKFRQNSERSRPDEAVVQRLRAIQRHITFRVFLGTWCSDSEEHVPPFEVLMEEVKNPFFVVEYYGVNRDMCDGIRMARSHNIQYVPTFVLLEKNKEIGRIVETPQVSIGKDILNILEGGV
ncbi:MAG: thioredoxin family protein [Gemmatimonadota bacterium]|nr:MAG: thioredoxin family protein [Gemmatimonadota bacterium]